MPGLNIEAEVVSALQFVVENGRVDGASASERMASAIEEVSFELLSESGLDISRAAIARYVREHYDPR